MGRFKMLPVSAVLIVGGLLFFAASAADAGPTGVIFNFSGLPNNTGTPSAGSDNSSAVATNMNTQLHAVDPNWSVTVSGAESSGAPPSGPGYTGDGNVVCKGGTSGTSCTPDTLSAKSTNPATYVETSGKFTFSSGPNSGDQYIKMSFSSSSSSDPVKVISLSFDFEIFPDGSSQQPPDFTFLMTDGSGGSTTVENCTVLGLAPGNTSAGTCLSPLGSSWNGSYSGGASDSTSNLYAALSYSTCIADGNTWSGSKCLEKNDQYLGSMTFTFPTTVSSATGPINLYFIDWPPTVAVTNIDWGLPPSTTTQVPEPGSLLLLASGLIAVGIVRRRQSLAL